ncbi:MAG: HEPN domain-containing protein [Clostridia bacterium]|nr:HEPN domain-containing protein [Clostridia bacterium]
MDSRRYLDWYDKAQKDMRGAEILFKCEGDNSLVAFHCQQAIEKALKGYILKHTEQLLDGHSLIFLIRRASRFDEEIRKYNKDCAFVNQFYIETRYPADIPDEVDESEVRECLETALSVLNHIFVKEQDK